MSIPPTPTNSINNNIVEPQHRFLGNIGAPLDPNWWNAQFDDDELDGDLAEEQTGSMVPGAGEGTTTLIPVVSSSVLYICSSSLIVRIIGL